MLVRYHCAINISMRVFGFEGTMNRFIAMIHQKPRKGSQRVVQQTQTYLNESKIVKKGE